MRVLAACSLGGAGHLRPLVPFLDQVRERRGETLVVGPPALADLVAATGHPFLAGGEPPEEHVRPIREQLSVAPPHEASVLGNRELFGRLATTAMLPAMERAVREWRPELILRDPCEYASAVAAGRLGIPAAQVAIGLANVEWESIGVAAPALEAHRDGLAHDLRRSLYLTRFPAALDPSLFPGTRRYRESAPAPRRLLPAWWSATSAPLIYVSFGTVMGHMSFAEEVYQAVIDAVTGLDARVLVTTGPGFEASRLRDLPENVHVEKWVDQADVLGQAELVVCHGGSGTAYGALAAGVPVVAVPIFADQFANAATVARAGAGLQVVVSQDLQASQDLQDLQSSQDRRRPVSRDDAPRIRHAIETVLADRSYRETAQAVAGEMAEAPAIGTLMEQLLRRQ